MLIYIEDGKGNNVSDLTEEEKLFASAEKCRFLIAGFHGPEGGLIKKHLRTRKITGVDEVKDSSDAWEKLELASYNFILINVDTPPADEILLEIVESHRFEKTALFVFSKTPNVYKESYRNRALIGRFIKIPFNMAELEHELLAVIKNGVYEKNQIGEGSSALGHFNRGAKALEEGNLDLAKEEMMSCIKADPAFLDAYLKISEILTEQNNLEKAMMALKKASRMNPNIGRTFYLLGTIKAKKENKDGAIESFDKAIGLEPNNVQLIMDIGNHCLSENWIDDALRYFNMIKLQHPEFHYIYNRIGIAYSRTGRFDEAEAEYNKALSLDEKDPGIHFNLGMLWTRKKDNNKAEECFKKALSLDPSFAEAGEMLKKIGSA